MDIYILSLITFASINVILAVGLNTISGFCGQISLGHAAFYGVGAYTSALLSVSGVPFVFALLAGMVMAGALGLIVGFTSLRVREDFLAITTMGVGFLFLGFVRKQEWLGGEFGVPQIPSPLPSEGFAALALIMAAGVIALSIHTRRSWMGRVFTAVASNEEAAQTLGVDIARYKLWAFVLGTTTAGLAGGLYAHLVGLIVPDAFDFIRMVEKKRIHKLIGKSPFLHDLLTYITVTQTIVFTFIDQAFARVTAVQQHCFEHLFILFVSLFDRDLADIVQ